MARQVVRCTGCTGWLFRLEPVVEQPEDPGLGSPTRMEGLLSPRHVRHNSLPGGGGSPTPKHRLRTLHRHLSCRSNEQLIKASARARYLLQHP